MMEIYRKHGTVVRWDNDVLVRVTESGEAIEEGDAFRCRPIAAPEPAPEVDGAFAEEAAARMGALHGGGVDLERVLVMEGAARHEIGDRSWEERSRRIFLSLVHRRAGLRVMLDLPFAEGGDALAVAAALRRVEGERAAGPVLRLAPHVSAALLPSMVKRPLPGARLVQVREPGALDGRGQPIVEGELGAGPWPNWYRPTYRLRPVRMPMHLRAEASRRVLDESLPRAVALVAPPAGDNRVRVLCEEGERVFVAPAVLQRVRAVAGTGRWYPHGAGVWASEMEVELEVE